MSSIPLSVGPGPFPWKEGCITYVRQPDGTYVRSGELPKGTKYAKIVSCGIGEGISIKRVSEWLEVLERGPLTREWYRVVPSASPKGAMSEEAKEKLAEISAQKKREKEVRE